MSTVLLGYRGCGKTTIGKRLADRLWQKFVDTDELIVRATGRTIRELFEQGGEATFRALESDLLSSALKMEDHVVALGGGAVLSEINRQLIRESGHKRIYLRCDPDVLLKRIEADPHSTHARPDLTSAGGSIEEIRSLLAIREPFYREVMTAEVDVSNLSPEEAVVYIARLI